MKRFQSLATARKDTIVATAMALATLLLGAFPASAQQAAENVVGVYEFNSNSHVGIQLHITQQVPIPPHPRTGQPRARIEGYVANAAALEPVVGFVTGYWSPQQSQPVTITFRRALQNGLVQTYQGAVTRGAGGRVFMAGIFSHPGAGNGFPWMAEQ